MGESFLVPGEKLIYSARLHWSVFLKPISSSLIFSVLGFFIYTSIDGRTFLIVIPFILISWMNTILKRASHKFFVTDKRVVIRTGIMGRDSFEIFIAKVESVEVFQSLLGRIFNCGKVRVSGSGGTTCTTGDISNPNGFRNAILQANS
jgi:uncharacterized membrane protein YdbT with pleckstrin-like domain